MEYLNKALMSAAAAAADMTTAFQSIRPLDSRGDPLLKLYRRRGYSGVKSRPHVHQNNFKQGMAVTAKTHKARKTIDHISVSPDYGLDRLQRLEDRKGSPTMRGGY